MNYLKKILIISICTASNIFATETNNSQQMSWPRIGFGLTMKPIVSGVGSFFVSGISSGLAGAFTINKTLQLPYPYSISISGAKSSYTIESNCTAQHYPFVLKTLKRTGFMMRKATQLGTGLGLYFGMQWANPEWEAAKKKINTHRDPLFHEHFKSALDLNTGFSN